MMIRNKSVVITSGFTDSYVPIEKALQRIGGIGGGVTQVAELPATGDEGKIYYNTTEKKYYTYTEENGWSEIGSGSGESNKDEFVAAYQFSPKFFGFLSGEPSQLPEWMGPYYSPKVGTTFGYHVEDADFDISYYTLLDANLSYLAETFMAGIFENSPGYMYEERRGEYYDYLRSIGIDPLTDDYTNIIYHTEKTVINFTGEIPSAGGLVYVIETIRLGIDVGVTNGVYLKCTILSVEEFKGSSIVLPKLHIRYTIDDKVTFPFPIPEDWPKYQGYILGIETMGYTQGYTEHINITHRLVYMAYSGWAYYTNPQWPTVNALTLLDVWYGEQTNAYLLHDIPLIDMIDLCGKFQADGNNITIQIPDNVVSANTNPVITSGHTYEWRLVYGVFTLIDISSQGI